MVGYTKFNRPRQSAYKNFEKRRRMMKQLRKKEKGEKIIPVADPELMTCDMLKKRSTNPRANITLSGKKKQKILKRLRRIDSENSKMQVELAISTTKRTKKTKQKTCKKSESVVIVDNDVEMKE